MSYDDDLQDTPEKKRVSSFFYVWLGWLPPPRFLSLFFFILLVFGLSWFVFDVIRTIEMCGFECLEWPSPPSDPYAPTQIISDS